MAIHFFEGFDPYNGTGANTGVQAKWSFTGTISRTALTTGAFSGQCLRCGQESTSVSNAYSRAATTSGAAWSVGFRFKVTGLSSLTGTAVNSVFIHVKSGTTFMVGLHVVSTGAIGAWRTTAERTGTQLGSNSAAGVIVEDTWHYIQFSGTVDDSTGTVVVKVDGATVLNLSSQDTRNGTPTTVDTVQVQSCGGYGGNDTIRFFFDDLYFTDSATPLGERRVETIYPTSDVAQGWARSAGSTNYTLVDEAQVNGDTDYVQGSSVSDTDTYGFGDLSSTPATIDALQFSAFAKKTDAASRSIALQAKSGATTSDGSDYALTASYTKLERVLTTDPNTAAAWTGAGVNALQGGPKVTV